MSRKPAPSTETRDLRALLAVVLDAIALPYDTPEYDRRLCERASIAHVVARQALDGAPDGLGWNVDYLRKKLTAEQADADERETNRCQRCRKPFDRADLRHDGAGRYASTPWCRSCIDNCRDGGTEHVCQICDPQRYGGGQ